MDKKKKILILGANGFIGRNLLATLDKNKFEIIALDRKFTEDIPQHKNVQYLEMDFFKEKNYGGVLKGVSTVIHLITSVTPASSMQGDTASSYEKDLITAKKFIRQAYEHKVKRIIFASSGGTVYGEQNKLPITENSNCKPLNNYGIVKYTIENILRMFNRVYGMKNIVLRITNPYGLGQDNSKKLGAIPIFIEKIVNGEEITIYGDGTITRDFIEMSDVIKSLINAISYEGEEDTFNISTGVGISLNDLIGLLEKKLGIDAKIDYKEARELDVQKNILDNTLMKSELKVENINQLELGIDKLIENLNLMIDKDKKNILK